MEDRFDELVALHVIACAAFPSPPRLAIWAETLFLRSWGEALVLWRFSCRNLAKIDFHKPTVTSGLLYRGVDSC
jgi:hypothetical protein